MCIIIAKDAGVKALDKEYFERAWDSNSHGGGLVWKNEGEDVYFQKGFMRKEDFLAKINTGKGFQIVADIKIDYKNDEISLKRINLI